LWEEPSQAISQNQRDAVGILAIYGAEDVNKRRAEDSDQVEMAVASDKWEVLATKRCDPEIVDGNRLADLPEVKDDGCIVAGSLRIYIEDGGAGQETFEPAFISIPMSRSGNSCALFSKDDNRETHSARGI